jgi:hypothetical protein
MRMSPRGFGAALVSGLCLALLCSGCVAARSAQPRAVASSSEFRTTFRSGPLLITLKRFGDVSGRRSLTTDASGRVGAQVEILNDSEGSVPLTSTRGVLRLMDTDGHLLPPRAGSSQWAPSDAAGHPINPSAAALPPGGRVVIARSFASTPGTPTLIVDLELSDRGGFQWTPPR